jgi:hypothetical protein
VPLPVLAGIELACFCRQFVEARAEQGIDDGGQTPCGGLRTLS